MPVVARTDIVRSLPLCPIKDVKTQVRRLVAFNVGRALLLIVQFKQKDRRTS